MSEKHFYFGLSTICFVLCIIAIDSNLGFDYSFNFQGVYLAYCFVNENLPMILKIAIISFVVMVYFFWKIIKDKKNHQE